MGIEYFTPPITHAHTENYFQNARIIFTTSPCLVNANGEVTPIDPAVANYLMGFQISGVFRQGFHLQYGTDSSYRPAWGKPPPPLFSGIKGAFTDSGVVFKIEDMPGEGIFSGGAVHGPVWANLSSREIRYAPTGEPFFTNVTPPPYVIDNNKAILYSRGFTILGRANAHTTISHLIRFTSIGTDGEYWQVDDRYLKIHNGKFHRVDETSLISKPYANSLIEIAIKDLPEETITVW